jgi:O-antigen ligase
VAIGVAVAFLVLVWRPFRRIAVGAGLFFAIITLVGSNPLGSVVNLHVLTDRIRSIGTVGDNPRVVSYERTPKVIRDHPLFGVGPDQFQAAAARYGIIDPRSGFPMVHAHNIPLNIAAERGLFGLAALIWWAIALARALVIACRRGVGADRTLALATSAAFLSLLVTGMADYSWQGNTILSLTFVAAGCAMVLARAAPEQAVAEARSWPEPSRYVQARELHA